MAPTLTSGNSDLYRAERPGSKFDTHKHTHTAQGCGLSRLKCAIPAVLCWVSLGPGGGGVTGCLPDDCSVSPIMGCHLLSSIHKGKQCVCESLCACSWVCAQEEEGRGYLVGRPWALFHVYSVEGKTHNSPKAAHLWAHSVREIEGILRDGEIEVVHIMVSSFNEYSNIKIDN